MYSSSALVVAFFLSLSISCVHAALYVIAPKSGSNCHGGQACTVQWLDDGTSPLLTSFGLCEIGLYTGQMKLVQTIEPTDVSTTHSLTFTPIPAAGPDSDTYYICFTSISASNENGTALQAFSPFFRLDQMSGDFSSPLAAATSSIPIPTASSTSDDSSTSVATITVGTLSTSVPPLSTLTATTPLSSSSGLTTSRRSSSPSSSNTLGSATSGSAAASSQSANSALSRTVIAYPTPLLVLSFCLLIFSGL